MKRNSLQRTRQTKAVVTTFCFMVTALFMAGFGANRAYATTQATYYVSPSGNDTNAGDVAHPFQTLEQAKQTIRTINSNMSGDIIVYVRGGTYSLASTLQFDQTDSGTNGYNIIYRAYPGEMPVISGGKTLNNWSLYDANKNIYRSYVGQTTGVLQMYVNGVRATVARSESGPSGFSVASYYPYLVVDALKVYSGSNVTTVNNNDPGITYSGAWTYDSNRSASGFTDVNNDASYTNSTGDYAQYTFNGTGVDLIVERGTNYSAGIAVYMDGVLDQTVSSNGGYAGQQTIYSKSGLVSGNHTIKIVNTPPFVTTTNSQYSNMSSWRNPNQIRIVSENLWLVATCGVFSISGGNISLKSPCVDVAFRSYFVVSWIENAYELLNSPGQFYYDVTDGYMYYIPRSYEQLSTASVIIPQVEQLVNGTGGAGTPIHNIQFIGLAFQYGTWLQAFTNLGIAGDQSNYYLTDPKHNYFTGNVKMGGNVIFNNAANIVIQGNTFSKLGGTALVFENESQQNTIIGNSFSDISAGGVHIGDTYDFANTNASQQSIGNRLIDNYVSATGVQYHAAVGFFAGYNASLQVSHNELDHLPYSGMSIGWGWGSESPTPYAKNNVISNNKVSNVMERLYDGGAIYTLSSQPGSVMTGNFVTGQYHNFGAFYLDNGTAGYNVNNNVVQNPVPYWLLVQKYSPVAYNNTVINNYTENSSTTGNPYGNGNSLSNTTVISPGSWPPAAISIMNSAGQEPGYSYLKDAAGVLVNDNASGVYYSGTWTYDTNRQGSSAIDYMNDAHYTSTSGDYVQYSFTGTGVDVIAETRSNFTTNAQVYVDSVPQNTIQENGSYPLDGQTVYSIGGLSQGAHTIQIVNGSSQVLLVDAFRVYGSITPVSVTGVSLTQSQISMNTGDTLDLTGIVSIAPSNATNMQIVWSSSNPAVVTVAAGTVKAVAAGSAIVTVTTLDGSFSASATVTVSDVPVTGVTLNPLDTLMDVGGTINLNPGLSFTPSNATHKQVTWSSSNTSVATVANGVVTGVAAGSAVITVTTVDGGFTATASITIGQNVALSSTATASSYFQNNASFAPGKAIDGNLSTEWASAGETNPWLQLNWTAAQNVTAVIFYDRVNLTDWAQGGTLTFSDGTSLSVSGIPNDGSPFGVSFATKTITWVKFQIAGGSSPANVGLAEMKVLGMAAPVTGVSLNPGLTFMDVGGTINLNSGLSFVPSNAANQQVTWSSSNTSVATVTNGVVTGQATGTTVITVTTVDGGFTATANIAIGQNVALSSTATASSYFQNNASFAPGKAIDGNLSTEWASAGETNPWLQLNWSAAQTVNAIVFYDRANLTDWAQGGTLTFSDGTSLSVSGIPNDGSPFGVSFATKTITWVKFQIAGGSSPANVGLAEMKVLTTPSAPVTGVSLNPGLTFMDVGGTLNVNPGLSFAPRYATNQQVTWSSSNTSVATVANGVVTGVAVGSAVITVTTVDGGFMATASITIGQNVALSSTATASSYFQNNASFAPGKAIDGNLSTEWASAGETNPWLQLNWTAAQNVTAVIFYDRVNLTDWAQGGTLTFSDGTSLSVSGIPNDGSPFGVSFATKTITWVKFQIAGGSSPANVGLAEMKVLGMAAPPVPVTGVSLNPSLTFMDVGGTINLNPGLSVTPSNATNKQVTWSSSNTSVATVANGVVTGVAAGSAVITVTTVDGGFTATASITIGQNVALSATATASSYFQNNASFAPGKAIDGNLSTEWASAGETNPWLQLNWTAAQTVNAIIFYDRANLQDWAQGGTLTFSDGTSLSVSGIPNDGSPYAVSFPAKTITWVKFQIAGGSSPANVGLAEMKVLSTGGN